MLRDIENFGEITVQGWDNQTDHLMAYTFNSDTEDTARNLYKALKKYGQLRFVTGVEGRTKNSSIQAAIKYHMRNLYGDKVTAEEAGCESTRYTLVTK